MIASTFHPCSESSCSMQVTKSGKMCVVHAASLQQAAAMPTSAGALVVNVAPPVAKGVAQGQCASRAADVHQSAAVCTAAGGQVTDQVPFQQ